MKYIKYIFLINVNSIFSTYEHLLIEGIEEEHEKKRKIDNIIKTKKGILLCIYIGFFLFSILDILFNIFFFKKEDNLVLICYHLALLLCTFVINSINFLFFRLIILLIEILFNSLFLNCLILINFNRLSESINDNSNFSNKLIILFFISCIFIFQIFYLFKRIKNYLEGKAMREKYGENVFDENVRELLINNRIINHTVEVLRMINLLENRISEFLYRFSIF